MKLKNYTSETPKDRSVSKIINCLVEMGAKNINQQYENKMLSGITFLIDINDTTVAFSLPAKVEAVFKVLWEEVKRPNTGTEQRIREQAERTAWKIISDWVEIQAAMIHLEQAEILQVFLPYALIGNGGNTLYESMKSNNFKLLN